MFQFLVVLKIAWAVPVSRECLLCYNLESLPWDLNFFSTHLAFCPLWVPYKALDDQDLPSREWTVYPQCVQLGEVVCVPKKKKNEIRVVLSKQGYEQLPGRSLRVGKENIRVKETTFSYEI